MPNKYSAASYAQRDTLHPDLQKVLDAALVLYNFSIVEGFRGKAAQNAAYAAGKSQEQWPNGKHNHLPSLAVDIYPWPIDWSENPNNIERQCLLAGIVLATAHQLGVSLRWGGDWNSNGDTRDEHFRDRGHIELA